MLKKSLFSIAMSFKRFPITLLLTSVVSVILIIISEITDHGSNDSVKTLSRVAMVIALGVPISLCIKLYFERLVSVKPLIKISAFTGLAAVLFLYYHFLLPDQNMVSITRYTAFSITFYLAALVLPYYYKKENFELFIIKLITSFIVTLVFSGVIFFGISAILFTIDKLLDIHVYSKLYLYSWIIIAGVFAPSYFLSTFPEYSYIFDKTNYSKFLKILLLYIVMPILSIYTLILYIYLFKVAATLKWPVNMVGNLVLWYSLIGTLVIFLIWPLISENKWVSKFVFWFPKFIIPLIIVMFVSVGIRIKAYGFTESRYFVLILGLWVLGIMLYWNLKKNRRNIVLPISLAIVAFLSVCGPWSAYSISINSQNIRFQNIISKYDMINNNKIVKPAGPISSDDQKEITAIISYFDRSHSLKDIKYLPDNFVVKDMKNVFGFEYSPAIYNNNMQYFSYDLFNIDKPYDISGFDFLFNFTSKGTPISLKNDNIKVEYNNQTNEIKIYSMSQEIYKNNLNSFAQKLYDKYGASGNNSVTQEDMTFTDENASVKLKFIIHNIYGNRGYGADEFKVEFMNFDMLLKLK